MNKYLVLSLLLIVFVNSGFGQRSLLLLQTKNKNKYAYYGRGDLISFKVHGNKSKIVGEILDLKNSVIVFSGFEVPISKIKCLYIDEKTRWWLRYKLAQMTLITGTGYVLLDVINSGEFSKDTLMVGGVLIGVGLVAQLIIGNKIKIKRRTKLRILNV